MLADISGEEEVEFGKNWTAGAWPRREIEKETVIVVVVVELLEQIPLRPKLRGQNTREREKAKAVTIILNAHGTHSTRKRGWNERG